MPNHSLSVRKHTSHEPYVKIVSLSFKNVNHTGDHFCLEGPFPQQVEQLMSEVKMSVGARVKGSAPLTVPRPDLAAHEGRM